MAKYLMNPSFSSLKYPEFRIYLIARFIFIMVLTMQATLISWKIFEITKDPFNIGLIGLVEFVPAVIMAFYAGYVIDRSDRKKLFHYSIGANLILTILFAYVTSQHAYNHLNQSNILMSMYGIVFCTGIARAFSGPSSFALVSSLVPKEEIPNAITWHSGS